jgi:amino acid adenylation domain-containing protein
VRIERFLEQSAQRTPAKTALVCGDRRLSYLELDRRANAVAAYIAAHGVRRGDRIAIYLENSVEAVIAVFAALKAGAVFVPINPSVKDAKLEYLLNDCGAVALVCERKRAETLAPAIERLRSLTLILSGSEAFSAADGACDAPVHAGIDLDLAALIYTSGSTGHAKGVMLSHLNMTAAAESIATYLELADDDIILDTLPLSFDYGLYQVLLAFKMGATVVLERSFTYPSTVLETLTREKVTTFPIVPTIAAILRQLNLRQFDLSSLRRITNTGAALPTAHVRELRAALPHVRIYLMYGLTECKRVSYLPPAEIDNRPDSVGRGMPNQEVWLVDEQGRRLESGVGELVIRGAHVMRGYWNLPEETARVLKPGLLPGEHVLYSGDIFRRDQDGYLYFVGRKDDIIKTRGEKVSPKEVENVLHSLKGVAEAVVVGVPDAILGEAVKAIVTLTDGAALSTADVRRHCSTHLEEFMVPKIVEFRSSMPLTASGKVDKRTLNSAAVN